jgi:hypothetical protein
MDRSRHRRSAILGCGILGILAAACDLERTTAPALPRPYLVPYADEPHLGPVRSYTGPAAVAYASALEAEFARVAARRTTTERALAPVGEKELANRYEWLQSSLVSNAAMQDVTEADGPFFVVAYTRVGIWNSGSRSDANVLAYSRTNYITNIYNDVELTLRTPSGSHTLPRLHDATGFFGDSLLITDTTISGLNCTTSAGVSAYTTHRAGRSSSPAATVFSVAEDSCAGNEECESSEEPPTGVAPAPSEPGYNLGDGSSGATGGGCGGSGGGTPPSSNCHDEYVYVERSTDGGMTWTVIWEGWTIVCA